MFSAADLMTIGDPALLYLQVNNNDNLPNFSNIQIHSGWINVLLGKSTEKRYITNNNFIHTFTNLQN